jgi:hypothetical protein
MAQEIQTIGVAGVPEGYVNLLGAETIQSIPLGDRNAWHASKQVA